MNADKTRVGVNSINDPLNLGKVVQQVSASGFEPENDCSSQSFPAKLECSNGKMQVSKTLQCGFDSYLLRQISDFKS